MPKGLPVSAKAKGRGNQQAKGAPAPKAKALDVQEEPGAEKADVQSYAQVAKASAVAAPTQVPSNPTADLAREMSEVLRSLRLEKIGLNQLLGAGNDTQYGLIDSGATSALRQAEKGELQGAKRVTVQLAVGEAELWMSDAGTLLSDVPVQPILPMAHLPALGCAVSWTDKGIAIKHPVMGLLPVRLRGACPEVPADLAVSLIRSFEKLHREGEALRRSKVQMWSSVCLLQCAEDGKEALAWFKQAIQREGCTLGVQLQFLRQMFPDLPGEIAMRVACPLTFDPLRVPFNRKTRKQLFDDRIPTLLNLFSGKQVWKNGPGQILGVDLCHGADMLSDDTFGMLLRASAEGKVDGALAGPPCRTTSACRHAADSGPRPVRARDGPERYGFRSNSRQEADLVFGDSVLWFRTLLFAVLSVKAKGAPFLGWEHPADPKSWAPDGSSLQDCASVWNFPEFQQFQRAIQAWQADFDQGALGHPKRKPSSMMTTSWYVYENLHGLSGPGSGKALCQESSPHKGFASSQWAEWAPGLVHVLQEGWREHVRTRACPSVRLSAAAARQDMLRALSPEWQAHLAADHVPYRKDCEVCLQAASRGRLHYKHDHASFYSLSSDICGPFAPGQDVTGKKKYFVVFTMRLPTGDGMPWQPSPSAAGDVEPAAQDSRADPVPESVPAACCVRRFA